MRGWKAAPLGDLATIVGGGTPARDKGEYFGGSIPWVTPKDMKCWEIIGAQETLTELGVANSAARLVEPNSVLVVVRSGVLKHTLPVAINRVRVAINQDMKALLCDADQVEPDYLARFLKYSSTRILASVRATTADNFPIEVLRRLSVPLPSGVEQRRIADVLDRAEALQAKRRVSLVQLDALLESVFLEMFGDPACNSQCWPTVGLGELLSVPLRNGTSPSKAGRISGKVLTLSAITGAGFDPTACKECMFSTVPPRGQTVDQSDFLVCRGNGNLRLVGRGFFPTYKMEDVAFPDTMIAVRVSPGRVERRFLQFLWNSKAVRLQIEKLARTTNGTLKINQAMLEGIKLIAPPLERQRKFESVAHEIDQMRSAYNRSQMELNSLFASLQHRAFTGAL